MTLKTVLVIDSEHSTRVQIRRSLEDKGHFVISASSAAEGLLLLEKTSVPDIMFVSTMAAMISGEHILALLRSQPKYAKVPAIQIKQDDSEASLNGICQTFTLPFNDEQVIEALKHCF